MQQSSKNISKDEIVDRILAGEAVQSELQEGYWLQLDLPLPLLVVFHQPEARLELSSLVRGESSYLVVPDKPNALAPVQMYIDELIKTRASQYSSFLLLDIQFDASTRSDIQILHHHDKSLATVNTLVEALKPLRALNNALSITRKKCKNYSRLMPNYWTKVVVSGFRLCCLVCSLIPKKMSLTPYCSVISGTTFLSVAASTVYLFTGTDQLSDHAPPHLRAHYRR